MQFQMQLRRQEARQLLLSGEFDAATVGFQVGYEDPAYFSRERHLLIARSSRDAGLS